MAYVGLYSEVIPIPRRLIRAISLVGTTRLCGSPWLNRLQSRGAVTRVSTPIHVFGNSLGEILPA
jgi:hypothetical protein